MNLIAPFNPIGGGKTLFIQPLPLVSIKQGEGFNYFGLGILIMIIIVLIKLNKIYKDINIKNNLPIIFISCILFIFSISNIITFTDKIILNIDYPWLIEKIGNILRASGRMFWPVYYLIELFLIIIIVNNFKNF